MLISSDTNVWLDFSFIGQINYPFLLDNSYYLSSITYHDEIDDNTNLPRSIINIERFNEIRKCVKENKLLITDATTSELKLAMKYQSEYRPPKISKAISMQDSIALAIAKERNWILLSGDGGLREAAGFEDVVCHGTLWIYDELLYKKLLLETEYLEAMYELLDAVENKKRRLPRNEILMRIETINQNKTLRKYAIQK